MSIRINENANIVHILNQARQSVNGLSRATQRLASGVRFESAGDDPGAIGSVIFTDKAITGIQRNQKVRFL